MTPCDAASNVCPTLGHDGHHAARVPDERTSAAAPRRAVLGGLAAGSLASLLGGMGAVSLSHPPVVFAAEEEGLAAAADAAVAASAAASSQAEGAILVTGANSGVGRD
jgi:hypothetical protein